MFLIFWIFFDCLFTFSDHSFNFLLTIFYLLTIAKIGRSLLLTIFLFAFWLFTLNLPAFSGFAVNIQIIWSSECILQLSLLEVSKATSNKFLTYFIRKIISIDLKILPALPRHSTSLLHTSTFKQINYLKKFQYFWINQQLIFPTSDKLLKFLLSVKFQTTIVN